MSERAYSLAVCAMREALYERTLLRRRLRRTLRVAEGVYAASGLAPQHSHTALVDLVDRRCWEADLAQAYLDAAEDRLTRLAQGAEGYLRVALP